ncbi:MAG: hypothetical protein JW854_16950 [Actinobacteria bacterium]|nr:hypothetical protein [Actinomycetota bacterium]
MSTFDIFMSCLVVLIMVILPLMLYFWQLLHVQKLLYLLSLDSRYEFFQGLWEFLGSPLYSPNTRSGYSIWTMDFKELVSGYKPIARPPFSEQNAARDYERMYLKDYRNFRARRKGGYILLPIFQTIFFGVALYRIATKYTESPGLMIGIFVAGAVAMIVLFYLMYRLGKTSDRLAFEVNDAIDGYLDEDIPVRGREDDQGLAPATPPA